MKAIGEEHPVKGLCVAFGVSRSAYYAWLARKPGPRALADADITSRLCLAHEASRSTYGSPRLVAVLRRQGLTVGCRYVRRLIRAAGRLRAWLRRWIPSTAVTRKGLGLEFPDLLLEYDFSRRCIPPQSSLGYPH